MTKSQTGLAVAPQSFNEMPLRASTVLRETDAQAQPEAKDAMGLMSNPPATTELGRRKAATEKNMYVMWSSDTITGNTQATAQTPQQGKAKGVVLHLTEQSVQCEFLHAGSANKVWLPRGLFPADIEVGYPFSLDVDRHDGYLAPRIMPRVPEPDPEIAKKIQSLLNDFEAD